MPKLAAKMEMWKLKFETGFYVKYPALPSKQDTVSMT